MGYYDGAEVQKCEAQGLTVYIPNPQTSANTKLGLFGKERFTYNPEQDVYVCPAGETLPYRFGTAEKGHKIRYYAAAACGRYSPAGSVPRPPDFLCNDYQWRSHADVEGQAALIVLRRSCAPSDVVTQFRNGRSGTA
jgi:hypothetical protein